MATKFKLSDTMQFLTGKLNAITGGEVALSIEIDEETVSPGGELHARAIIRSPEATRRIDYVQISLKGTVQRDGSWQEYVQSAEVAHDTALPSDHAFVVPIVIVVPNDAVLTEDGAAWSLYARAYLDKSLDPRAETAFHVG